MCVGQAELGLARPVGAVAEVPDPERGRSADHRKHGQERNPPQTPREPHPLRIGKARPSIEAECGVAFAYVSVGAGDAG